MIAEHTVPAGHRHIPALVGRGGARGRAAAGVRGWRDHEERVSDVGGGEGGGGL